MGWIRDGAYDHEGWVANVLADQRVSSSSTAGGVIVRELLAEDIAAEREARFYPATDHVDVVVPWAHVATWRVVCECGWTGSQRPAVVDSVYGTRECPESLANSWAVPEWEAHVTPFAALTDLERLIREQHDLGTGIADTVRHARTGGASWTQIGRAAGLSKQGAQQRWGQL